jgi:hypothetical protein
MKIYYYNNHIEFWDLFTPIPGFKPHLQLVLSAYGLDDISENIWNLLNEDQTDTVFYFFMDLETQ